jgi:alkylation response protein AidB-like acyl-CoA dehydrogenase
MVAPKPVLDAAEVLGRAESLAGDFATRAAAHDRDASFPFENFERLADAGLLNLTVPARYGGMEAGLALSCRVIEQIAGGDASTALVLAMHFIYHATFARARRGSPALWERVCRESVEGIALINVMRVEPDLGTPSRGGLPATTGVRTASGWRLSGHKVYATGSPILRYFLVWGRTEAEDGALPRVGYFLVPSDLPGVEIVETWDHMGMRATGSHDLILREVELPEDHALELRQPAEWGPDPVVAGWNTLILSALYHGVAVAAADWLRGYLHERVPANLGASLATLPRFQSAVGEIEALRYASDRLIYGLAEQIDAGDLAASGRSSLVKFVSNANAIRMVDIALGLIGNPGLARGNPLERHHRDVLCSRIHTPQDDMILASAGRSVLSVS